MGWWVVSVTPRPRFTPEERTPGTHCTGGWVGPRAGLDTEARGKILFPCRGSNPDRPVIQPVVRHYTDWATRLLLYVINTSINNTAKVKFSLWPNHHAMFRYRGRVVKTLRSTTYTSTRSRWMENALLPGWWHPCTLFAIWEKAWKWRNEETPYLCRKTTPILYPKPGIFNPLKHIERERESIFFVRRFPGYARSSW
jgi:hypothetical protein